MRFRFYKQYDIMDCGPTCLRMVARYHGVKLPMNILRNKANTTREGASLRSLSNAANEIGFDCITAEISFEQLNHDIPLPCILHWNNKHYIVVPPQNYEDKKDKTIKIADPGTGIIKIPKSLFIKLWMGTGEKGVVMILSKKNGFTPPDIAKRSGLGMVLFFAKYLSVYKNYIVQILLALLLSSIFSLAFPVLTQNLVDYGINNKDLSFVTLILASQLIIFAISTVVEIIKGWLMLHMNTRVNMAMIYDFLSKLLKLPISFFDIKMIGDIHQRIADHRRVQTYVTNSIFYTLFSFFNMVMFAVLLGIYSIKVLGVFLIFSLLSTFWIFLFLRKRKELDYVRFRNMGSNQNVLYELISSIQEIKLNNCEASKMRLWQREQARLYDTSIKSYTLDQYQGIGNIFFQQLKNIIISFISAREVIQGNMTLGMMMSIGYIAGQLNSPIGHLLSLVQTTQDAKISLDRISEIHEEEEEENNSTEANVEIPTGDICFHNVYFKYKHSESGFALENLNICIPSGKITAIVGQSGSGKTTLMKLLLKFYPTSEGTIYVGDKDLSAIGSNSWRHICGSVMQDGYIFSDTIINNICLDDDDIDMDKIEEACKIANIHNYIMELPAKYETQIGKAGLGLSTGQKQRLLIARSVYRDPHFIFYDEATSALDAHNERTIVDNLNHFFAGKTVVIIAHRLSTVINADQIVMLEKGRIVEVGTHKELIDAGRYYYRLVKNQLELTV